MLDLNLHSRVEGRVSVVLQAKGRMSRRKDGKYFLYLPKSVVEDSAFPFGLESSVRVIVIIDRLGRRLLITPPTQDKRVRRKRDWIQHRRFG